jgi:hypothetical protein
MARKTVGEKVDELEKNVAAVVARLDNACNELSRLPDLRIQVAVLEQRIVQLEKSRELWGQRLWLILAPLVGAVVGSLLTFLLRGPS